MSEKTPRLPAPPPCATIPEDLIADNILPRLPSKTLLRFRSVCKHWKSLISDNPDFANLHLQFHRQNNKSCLLYEVKKAGSKLLSLNVDPYVLIEVQNYDGDLGRGPILLGSSNGLLCLQEPCSRNGYVLLNPATRVRRVIRGPPRCCGYEVLCQGLGFSSLSNDFKIVALFRVESIRIDWGSGAPQLVSYAYVFDCKGNRWRKVDLDYSPPGIRMSDLPKIGNAESKKVAVQVGQVLHWGLHGWSGSCFDPIVLAFDFANDSIRSIGLPDPLQDQSCRQLGMINSCFLSEIRNCLCMCWRSNNTQMLQVWMLEQCDEVEFWKMFLDVKDVSAYWYRNLLDVKDDSGRVVLLHDDCYKVITPGCGVDQEVAAVLTHSYQHRLQLTCAVSYIDSLISPFTQSRGSKRVSGMKNKEG